MIVEHLSLVDFRNYATAELALHRGPNVLVGRNGQGKTNLAEAVVFLATLGSHRVSSDAPMVRDGQEFAVIRARLAHGERRVLVEVQLNRQGSNKARINGSPSKTNELPRYAHVVLFAPEDLQIVRGDPSARRRFADQLLIQRTPRLAAVLGDYDRVLKQRNALLKSARARGIRGEALSTLDVWDDKLVSLGSEIITARQRLASDLQQPVADAYAAIAGADHRPRLDWALSVAGSDPEDDDDRDDADGAAPVDDVRGDARRIAEMFRASLAAKRSNELDRGLTLTGPHRDDLVLRVRDLPVKGYASHGESWSVALALRLASAELLRSESPAGDPVLILDDVFAELDADRRQRLAALTAGYEQVVVTAAVEEDIPDVLHAHVVRITAGTITDERDRLQGEGGAPND
ncbi:MULTISPECIES: DNA replication/repair protein RecF [unclassified Microbacterium]|uniref:DNA replication/repair protein RecF n=1 Tax=unclassified Microbacterium TaxID=2609290 RepID=UPI00246983FD|nr:MULTISPECIES: DNA replication/repair protein RecF [unclassified Microbacterium]MDH5132936.1 DNA replication/repair protein RecF [Microbacterium sp. RD10]MDH5136058.1 DNA replication/repair protein RecF [Microbacterium sp. RD11]MDH5145783.1 DNA replication/repair protein RecF [Microbacterium sp. RD12]MDH5154462.1 DNA replication/repair protein RecF [Microbacterium sp. RD06]MDH5167102.1 DNA replication/repair protein RecF [Microbacterium sp. RD02]